ncbi:MAG: HEAT repeat domain-containing protein [Candidatus Aminicenantes bacterium]|nr:HEAT repeat domain-containing protein [Candidatus Aminicenantes bacterium]
MEHKPGSFPFPVDGETIRQVKDIIGRFVHTIAAMRLYPFGHINVTKFRDNLYHRLTSFLEEKGEFEIEIKENVFIFAGGIVFQEDSGIKSLPFLYFNEGMRALTFIPGLTREELYDFLEITANFAERPTGESDLIEELWERDFEFIRYDAAEGFLEAKVAAGLEGRPLELQVDRNQLFSGRIRLDTEDQAAANARSQEVSRTLSKDAAGLANFFETFDRTDQSSLESMVTAEHDVSSDKEFIETVFEVLYLEDRQDKFVEILGYLESYLQQLFKRADLGNAVLLLNSMSDLQKALRSSSPVRSEALLKTIREITLEADIGVIREIARPERVDDPRTLYEFLAWLGPRMLPIGTDVFESSSESSWHEAGVEYLRIMIRDHPAETVAMAQSRKPDLTKTLIALLGEQDDKKAVLQLANFAKSEHSEIRLEAVRTLGTLSHDIARKLILEYLNDPDERVRIEAGRAARLDTDERALAQVLQIIQGKAFLARSSIERGTLLLAVGRSNTAEAAEALKNLVRKRRLFGRERLQETRLLAVAGLAAMKIPAAREALQAGSQVGNQAVATACAQALRKRADRRREDA